jgi:hypothetical protein
VFGRVRRLRRFGVADLDIILRLLIGYFVGKE